MSFDALVYAHSTEVVREAEGAAWISCPSLPFLGYTGWSHTDPHVEAETESWKYFIGELNTLKREDHLDTYKGNFPKDIDSILKKTVAPKIPLLSWRGRVKNFITLGSPIDKYHVLWWPKYLHMGLKRNGSYPDDKWKKGVDEKDVDDWLTPPSPDQRIKHYNFCDEQDPVGHNLDVAQGTKNYRRIFDPDPVSERDIVFRRYAKPGAAHVMYWEDKELFQRLIDHIISPGENSKPQSFLEEDFRNRKKAFKQALLWAYFRIPFFAALLTGLLIIYVIFGKVQIYQVAAGLASILLWIQPNLSQGYKDEANPEDFDKRGAWQWYKTSFFGRIRTQRGIFARLVAGMIDWRRVVLTLREEHQTAQGSLNERGALVTSSWSFWWRFLLRIGVVLVFLSYYIRLAIQKPPSVERIDTSLINIVLEALQNPVVVETVIVLLLTYILTMLYVAMQFVRSRSKHSGHGLKGND